MSFKRKQIRARKGAIKNAIVLERQQKKKKKIIEGVKEHKEEKYLFLLFLQGDDAILFTYLNVYVFA